MILNKNNLFDKDINLDNKQIKLYIGNNNKNLEEIKNILLNYKVYLDDQQKKKLLGLDFEFNKGTIAMAQLNLDKFLVNNKEVVLLFDPTDKIIENLFRKIILHPKLWICLHGGESLDIPYLTKQLIKKAKDMVLFFKNLIDTKYLCDYSLLKDSGRCKINYFLYQQKIITKKFLDDMLKNEEKMGPIYLVHVDVKKLSDELLLYSAYDVIFLPELIRKLENKLPMIEIIRFLQINYLMKYNLLKNFNETKIIIDKINNSYFTNFKTNNRLIDIITPLIEIAQSQELNNLKNIPGFKKIIELIEKSYLYPIFIKKNNLKLIDSSGNNLKPLTLPSEIENIFTDLQKNIISMIN